MDGQARTWIFVSHASADIETVRAVRNHLEKRGASPLLFHLMALTDPEEFWPLIEREIQARSFFLYCESAAAEKSEWVRREREAVEAARRAAPKRVAHLRVEDRTFDRRKLDGFVRQTMAFPIFDPADEAAVQPYLRGLAEAGFRVLQNARTKSEVKKAIQTGWTVILLSQQSMQSSAIQQEIVRSKIPWNARVFTVLLDAAEPTFSWSQYLAGIPLLKAEEDPRAAPAKLVAALLDRPFGR